jgi:dTDP-4-amino-4,6-dideoxygalactose transaminase
VRVRFDWRLDFIDFLRSRGVATGIHFMAAHRYTFYRDCRREELPVTEQLAQEVVTLPLHSHMPLEKAQRVVAAVQSFARERTR